MAAPTPDARKQSVVKKRIAVICGGGYINTVLCKRILDQGHEFTVIGRSRPTEFAPEHYDFVLFKLFKPLQSALLIVIFLQGRFSQYTLKVTNQKDAGALEIIGGNTRNLDDVRKSTSQSLAAHLRKLGGYILPGEAGVSETVADIHYARTLPKLVDEKDHSGSPHINSFGCLQGSDGLYMVNGAVFNQVAAKKPLSVSWLTRIGSATTLLQSWNPNERV